MYFASVLLASGSLFVSKTGAKYIHLKTLSATGRTRLPVRSFCPPPVTLCESASKEPGNVGEVDKCLDGKWAASCKKVPNGLSPCHAKRRMGVRGPANPSFGMRPTFQASLYIL